MSEILRVKVKPNARNSAFEQLPDGTWLAQIKAPPVDGKANDALLALVASHFGVPRSRVSIKSGASARFKTIKVES